jgi:microcystin-dependent protein
MSQKYLANNSITLPNTTDISVSTSFTTNNNFTMTGSLNAQNSSVYLPASANIFFVSTSLSSLLSSSGIPAKTIAIWNSDTIPTGWAICNGTQGTPDLRGRFVICAGSSYARGTSGGSSTATLSVSTMPAHTHGTFATDNFSHRHSLWARDSGSGGDSARNNEGGDGTARTVNTGDSGGNHIHPAGGLTNSTGSSASFNIIPPYHVLIYIMKL